MPIIAGGDLTLLRSKNHKATIYASIIRPLTLWTALVADPTITKGETVINFDTGAGLAFGEIVDPQSLWVGTSAGDKDVGVLRVKSIVSGSGGVSGTVTVAANALDLADNLFLTFKQDYYLTNRYPLITGPPLSATFFKDTTVTYVDQNDVPSPVCICGENRSNFINSTLGYWEIESQMPQSYTMAPGATISSYSAVAYPATGVTININAGTGVGWIRFATPGQYWVHYSVVDSEGNSQKSYRAYYVHSSNPQSPHFPFRAFTVNSISGDWNRGGWEAGIKVHDPVDLDDIPDKALIILWQVPEYDTTEKNITFLPDESNTILSGYVRKEKLEHDISDGLESTDFQIVTLDELMRSFYMFSISLAARENPAFWYEYGAFLDCRHALHHYWLQHSTLFEIADVFLGDNEDGRAYAELEDGTLYSQPDDLTRGKGIRAHVVCDKGNRVHLTYDIQLLTDTERALLDVVQSIEKADRSDTITILREPINRTAFVKTSGFVFDGTFAASGCPDPPCPNVTALCASAPGIMPSDEGANIVDFDRQVFRDQTHCNQIAGRLFAQINNLYPEVRIDFHGNYHGVLDVAYPEFWTLDLSGSDTPRELNWTDQKLICRQVNTRVDVEKGIITSSVTFEPEMPGSDGVAGYCLDTVPDHGGEPPVIENPEDPELITGSSVYVLEGTNWSLKTAEQTDDLILDPFWTTKQASTDPADAIVIRCGVGYIKRSLDGGNTWSVVTPGTDPPNVEGDAPAPTATDLSYVMISGKLTDEFVIAANWQAGSDWRSWLLKTDDDFATFSWAYVGAEDCTVAEGGCTALVTPISRSTQIQRSQVTFDSGVTIVIHNEFNSPPTLYLCQVGVLLESGGVAITGDLDTIGTDGLLSGTIFTPCIYKISAEKAIILYSPDAGNRDIAVRTVTYSAPNLVLGTETRVFTADERAVSSGVANDNGITICCPTDDSLLVIRNGGVLDGTCTSWVDKGLYYACATVSGTTITFSNTTCGLDTIRDWQPIYTAGTTNSQIKAITRQSTLFTIGWYDGSNVRLVSGTYGGCGSISFGAIESSTALDSVSAFDFQMITDNVLVVNAAVLALQGVLAGTRQLVLQHLSFAVNVTNLGSSQLITTEVANTISPIITSLTTSQFIVDLARTQLVIDTCHGSVLFDYNGVSFSVNRLCQHQTEGQTYGASRFSDTEYIKTHRNGYCFIDTGDFAGCAKPYNVKTLGVTLDAIGLFIYLTVWDQVQERIFLLKYDYATLSWQAGYYLDGFGVVTEAELNAQTYIAWPYTSPDDFDRIYALGRMPNPEFTTTLGHVVTSGNAGSDWALVEDTWGSGWGSAAFEKSGTLFAIRSTASDAKLYKDSADLNLVLKTTLTFPNGVKLHALKVDAANRVVVGGDGGNAIMVLRVLSPYDASKIGNITYDHGTATGINALEVLE